MKRALVFGIAAFVFGSSGVVTCGYPAAAQVSPASPLPSASPDSLDQTFDVDGVGIPLRALATLTALMMSVYVPMKGAHPTSVIVTKKQSEMPAFDPDYHYAGTDGTPDKPHLTMWISDRLGGKAPRLALESAAILGILDSGMGGPQLQQVYAAARKDDLALGPAAPDAWKNRRALSVRLTVMVDAVMDVISKQRTAPGSAPP
jgi:hypothetical protein